MRDQRNHNRARRILSAAVDNWFSRAYLVVCAALLIWTALDAAFVDHPDASMAGVWPVAATLPTSLLVLMPGTDATRSLPEGAAGALMLALIAVAALVNATLLGLIVRLARRGTSHA